MISPKSQQILEGARCVFLQYGYAASHMDLIALRSRVSKSTLYAHFDSKERLFVEVVEQAKRCLLFPLPSIGDRSGKLDIRATLRQIGVQILQRTTTPEMAGMYRTVIGATQYFPAIGKDLALLGGDLLSDLLAQHLDLWSLLTIPNTRAAARHFLSLVKADLLLHCVLDRQRVVTAQEIDEHVQSVVDLFLGLYGWQSNAD
jgi:AcrR family transcriptional regulator